MVDTPAKPPDAEAREAKSAREPLPRWKKILIALATVLVVLGAVLTFAGSTPETAPSPGAAPGAAAALVDGGSHDPNAPSSESGTSAWGSGFLRMGFSFFVGLTLGFLLRAFLRVTLMVLGSVFLLLTWFTYLDFVTVNWEAIELVFQHLGDRIGMDFGHLRSILTGHLPQAGLGTLGLLAGFKKR